jgi:hypothetical protein
MRVLLASEGESDEIVGETLIRFVRPNATIIKKRFPARGFHVVRRSIDTLVRAGHFQLFDTLVVHFDLDNSLDNPSGKCCDSPRWQEIQAASNESQAGLRPVARERPLRIAFMSPCQSTDAWILWGRDGGDGTSYQYRDRHQTKSELFGTPARSMIQRTQGFMAALERQLKIENTWPKSLRDFISQLSAP